MKYRVDKNVEKNNYTVTFTMVEQSEQFKEAVKDFGDKVILIGGDFTKTETVTEKEIVVTTELKPVFEADGTTPVYEADGVTQKTEEVEIETEVEKEVEKEVVVLSLDKSYKYFPRDFVEPFTRTFSKAHYGDKVEEVARTYEEEMRKRIEELVLEYKGKADTFSSSNEYIV